ncbi:MAG TPA: DoxX family protein [Polyangiaceae bacterium]|nr:DoxX family protein [Polyangiaceae bacterium]
MEATSTVLAASPLEAPRPRVLRYATTGARVLLGLVFFTFGLDGFLHFVPQPDPSTMPPGSVALAGALMASGYMFPLIKGTEVLVGTLLLANRFVPLALVLLAPVIVNIVLFHAFLAPSGVGLAVVLVALQLFLAWTNRAAYRPLLAPRA